jgi:glycosyltransferase involved in cell wall biosynthesis
MVAGVREEHAVEISVVVPVYGCRGCLEALHERLVTSLEPIARDFEIVLVDDRSPDGAWEAIEALAERDPRVRGFRLSRNFGQHAAITAGLAQSRGRWTVVMDCDLQEPPEEIPRLYATAREGYEVVHTRRRRGPESWPRRVAGRAYFRLRNVFLGTRTGTDHGTLSILARPVVDAFLRLGDRDREYLIALDWLGFRSATLEVDRAERHEGRSSYTLGRLARVAVDGLFFQTTTLLRWIVAVGFLIAIAGLGLAVYDIVLYATSGSLPGYTSLAVLVLVLGGFIITSLGVVGLYVGKIFEQVKGRPLFVIDRETEGAGVIARAEVAGELGEPREEPDPAARPRAAR